MGTVRPVARIERFLRVCSYEDRPEAIDGLILMGESLCRVDSEVSLHLTVPEAPASLRAWAEGKPKVVLTTKRPDGVSGWDVKPWLLLEELNEGWPAALWLDADMIVTRSISRLLEEFPSASLVVAEEWNRHEAIPVTHLWELPAARPVPPINSCFVRATQAHRPLLARWLQLTRDPRYREAQTLPFDRRPWHLASDQVLLTALLETEEFGRVPFEYLHLGRDIAQCAGSSGYRPLHRFLDLFRGLPPLIHCIGRKPWMPRSAQKPVESYLTALADDVSAYVLAARPVARDLGMRPRWILARTWPGSLLRTVTAGHPALAGLPLAIPHALLLHLRRRIEGVLAKLQGAASQKTNFKRQK
jgi:hypothetical protein